MADDIASLSIRVDSRQVRTADTDLDKFTKSADRAERSTKDFEKASGKAETATSNFGNVLKIATGALVGYSSVLATTKLKDAADEYINIQNAIKQVTDGTTELTSVTNTLFELSKETRSSVSATASLYQKLALSTEQLGLSQEEIIDLTGTINKAFALSGATANEAAGAIRQLGQGLASGALRGDEFNSVAEQAPIIMRAIAAETRMTIGELREFAAEGGITAEIVVNALKGASDTITDDFGQSVATFGQSMEIARTNLVQFAGESTAINSVISAAGGAVVALTENLDGLTTAATALGAAGLAGMMVSAASSMSAYTIVMKGAIAAQVAFNAVAAINPWVLIGSAIAGTVAAIYSFTQAQESAIDVWERAKQSEADFRAAQSDIRAENRIQEIVKERMELEKERQELEESGLQNHIYNKQKYAGILEELKELEEEYHKITNARIEATKAQTAREEQRAKAEEAAKKRQIELEKSLADAKLMAAEAEKERLDRENLLAMEAFADVIDEELSLLNQLNDAYGDTTKATREYAEKVNLLTQLYTNTGSEKYLRMLQRLVNDFEDVGNSLDDAIKEATKDAADESTDEFVNSWNGAADMVAKGLYDALASGDWNSLGDAIGGALSSSIASIVSKNITDSLATNLTANSSMLAQIGGAFAGPLVGAIAGAAITIALQELEDYFSDNYDPTEARQAAIGTGTVLGSINEKTESIRKATDISATAANELIGINRDMLKALNSLNEGISKATARVARGVGDVSLTPPGTQTVGEQLGSFGGLLTSNPLLGLIEPIGDLFSDAIDLYLDSLSDILTFGLLDFGKILGGKSKKKDEGIQIIGGYISDLIDETVVNAYQTFRVKKNFLDDYDTSEISQRLSGEVETQFALVFASIFDSVAEATEILGLDVSEALANFEIESTRISLEGLDAAGQQEALQAFFGSVFDNLTAAAVPFLEEFQRAGEGLGETLSRIAATIQTADEVLSMLGAGFTETTADGFLPMLQMLPGMRDAAQGVAEQMAAIANIQAKERLIELSGGIENFISSSANFVRNFMSESEQFELNADALTRALGDLGLPETRDGFLELVQAQDAATEAGAENIATLLRLQGAADQYYDFLEKQEAERLRASEQAAAEAQRIAEQAAREAEQAAEQALREAERLAQSEQALRIRLATALGNAEEALRLTRERELAAVTETERALLEQIYAAEDAAKAAAESLEAVNEQLRQVAELSSATDNAMSRLKAAVNAEKAAITEAFRAATDAREEEAKTAIQAIKEQGRERVESIKAEQEARTRATEMMLDAAKEGLQAITTELRGITSALERLSGFGDRGERREDAVSFLRRALASGDLTGTGAAAGTAANIQAGEFASAFEFQKQIGLTRNLLQQLEDQGADQESDAQRVVDSLTAQLDVIKSSSEASIAAAEALTEAEIKRQEDMLAEELAFLENQYNAEIEVMDGILEQAQNQLDALRGIDNSIQDVGASLEIFFAALMSERTGRIEAGETVPAFANGGLHAGGARIVGESGPELEFTGPSRIISNSDFMEAMTNNKLREEIAQLRSEMNQALFAIARNTFNTNKQLDEWDGNGIPGTRPGAVLKTETA